MRLSRNLPAILGIAVLALTACSLRAADPQPAQPDTRKVIPVFDTVDDATMQSIYEQALTPYKYGVVLTTGDEDKMMDCPTIFRRDGRWWMTYIVFEGQGYETFLAVSDDLLKWEKVGCILARNPEDGWDKFQKAGYAALVDNQWGGSYEIQSYDDKYWMTYFGGNLDGYETDPLSIGMAWTEDPTADKLWQRLPEPILSRDQPDVRYWERVTQFKSMVIKDQTHSLGYPFVMYYNAKSKLGYERIGMAVSSDMRTWHRYGRDPVIDNGQGISGDPQIVRMGDVWVMFYFGAFYEFDTVINEKTGNTQIKQRNEAFDTFAASHDLVHWTKWEGPHLIAPSEPFDKQFAHKPWMIKWNDVVYHFYCAVGEEGRVIALATSKPLK